MNNVKKGTDIERKIRKMWENKNYLVDFKYRNKFQKNTDIFNLWDFQAPLNNGEIAFVQVKSTMSGVSKFKKKGKEYLTDYGMKNMYLIWYYNTKNKKHRVFEYEWEYGGGKWVEWGEVQFAEFGM